MSKMNDFSLDVETLSTRYDAAILSIGCVRFDRDTGEIGSRFYKAITLDTTLRSGHVSGDTLTWWMGQSSAAKRVLNEMGREPLANALHLLGSFIRNAGAPRVWGNGASFDITILEAAFVNGGHGLTPPWHYMNIRDMRTIVDAAIAKGFDPWQIPKVGTIHHAGDDAEYQARVIASCWQVVTGKKVAQYEDDEL